MKKIFEIIFFLVLAEIGVFQLAGCSGGGVPESKNTTSASYTISGSISGLVGSVVMQVNGGDNLTVSSNGKFTFSTPVANNNTYNVTILTQPAGQLCTVNTSSGTVSGGDVTNVAVVCSMDTNTFSVGGVVSGLNGTVVLQNNNGDNLAVSANGTVTFFTFATQVANNSPYSVTVLTQPTGQNCSIASGTGIILSNVINVTITCAANTYTIGGSVTGLNGSMVLQNNSGDNLTISVNGDFTFAAAVAYGNPYDITVLTQPVGYSCSIIAGSGVAMTDIKNVAVSCVKLPPVCFAYLAYATSGNVAAYKMDSATGALSSVDIAVSGSGSKSIAVDAAGKFVYVANYGTTVGSGSITAYKIDATYGTLTAVAGSPFVTGANPSAVTVDPSGQFLYVTDSNINLISAYAIDGVTGALTNINNEVTGNGPSSIAVDPSGKFAYVSNYISTNVSAYKIDSTTGGLISNGTIGPDLTPVPVYTPPGQFTVVLPDTQAHPSAIVVDTSGKFVYMTNYNSNNVLGYTVDLTNGLLSNTTSVQTTLYTYSYSVTVSPSGKFIYVAVSGNTTIEASVWAYEIDPINGSLYTVAGSPFLMGLEMIPRTITIDPSGKFAYVASSPFKVVSPSTTISTFSINTTTGALTNIGSPLLTTGSNPAAMTTTCTVK